MTVIIRLQNLPLTAISIDIRNFFRGLSIPDGGVHIVGGPEGDAFIAFSTDEDARQAMQLSGQQMKGAPVRLSLSSRNEMLKVIEQARVAANPGEASMVQAPSIHAGRPNEHSSSDRSNLIHGSTGSSNFIPGAMPQVPGLGNIGMLGMSFNGTGFLGQNNALLASMGQGMNGMNSSSTSSSSQMAGKNDMSSNSAPTTTPFGIPVNLTAGMGMNFSQMMSNANGMPSMNPTVAMMGAGLPASSMMNLTSPPAGNNPFIPTASHQMNAMNQMALPSMTGTGSHMAHTNASMSTSAAHMHPNVPQQPLVRPPGFPGMNPAFMVGGSGINNARFNGPRGPAPTFRGRNPNTSVRPSAPYGRDRDDSSHSPMRDRRDRDLSRRDDDRRRRSRSRDRDRRRRSRSRSRSRSPRGRPGRRDSREKDDGRRGDSNRRDSRDSDPPATPFNTTDEHHPALKLIGVPNDCSYREIKEFIRVDIMGGGDGVVRLYDEGLAYIKLDRPSDFPRAYRSNGRRLRDSLVTVEAITIERWVDEYKANKSRLERDIDTERERARRERNRNRDRDDRGTDRPERGSGRHSRFDSDAVSSSYLAIRNLPPTATTREVSSRLLNGLLLTDVAVVAGPTANGRHTSIAYVQLDSVEMAQQAIDMIVRSQDGSNLVVELSTAEEFHQSKNRTGSFKSESDALKPAAHGDAKSIFDLESGLDDDSCTIIIKGAPPVVQQQNVYDFFSDIGICPVTVKIMYDTDGSCNGQIICEFNDPHLARRATTKDGMVFGRNSVHVELIPNGRKHLPDNNILMGGKLPYRPSLLGPRPMGAPMPRFGAPPGPNPFLQALQGDLAVRPSGRGPRPPNPRFGGPGFGRPNGDHAGAGRGRGSRHGAQPAADMSFNFGKSGCILALENVPYKASMDDILEFLSSILKIEISRDRIIRRFDESEKPTGDARVAFDTPAEAKLAHDRLFGTKMWNRLITFNIV